LKNFSAAVERNQNQLQSEIVAQSRAWQKESENWHTTLRQIIHMHQLTATVAEMLTEELILQSVIDTCSKGYLSQQLITQEELQTKIKALLMKPAFEGLETAVEDLSLYYTERLTHCTVTEADINVWIKIPLRSAGKTWKISSFRPIPFAWRGSLCKLFSDTDQLIAAVGVSNNDNIIPFVGPEREHCLKNAICQIPRIDFSFSTEGRCLSALFKKRTVAEAAPFCQFHCTQTTVAEILRISPDEFIVATPRNESIVVRCGKKEIV